MAAVGPSDNRIGTHAGQQGRKGMANCELSGLWFTVNGAPGLVEAAEEGAVMLGGDRCLQALLVDDAPANVDLLTDILTEYSAAKKTLRPVISRMQQIRRGSAPGAVRGVAA